MRVNEAVSPVPSPQRGEPSPAPAPQHESLFGRLKDGFEKAKSAAENVVQGVEHAAEGVASTVGTVAKDVEHVASNVVQGAEHVAGTVVKDVENVAGIVVSGVEKAASGLASVAGTVVKDVENVAGNVVSGVEKAASGLVSVAGTVLDDVEKVAGNVVQGVEHVAGTVLHDVEGAVSTVVHGAEHVVETVVKDVEGVASTVVNAVKDVVHDVEQGVEHLWSEFQHVVVRHARVSTHLQNALVRAELAAQTLERKAKDDVKVVEDFWNEKIAPKVKVENNPALPVPPDKGGIQMASYNVELGGIHPDQVEADLKKMNPDVACLQECSPETAERLAKNLGYHVAILTDQKAILSRYPISSAKQISLPGSLVDRIEAAKASHNVEPLSTRRALEATIQIGNRKVDILDAHLGLNDTKSNGRQVNALAELVAQRQAQGKTVLLAGDFNDNFMLAQSGTADAAGTRSTATDTTSEFKDRYGHSIVGNIGDANVAAAAKKLLGETNYYWNAPNRQVLTSEGLITPEQALAELKSGSVAKDSPRYLELERVADGTSHLSANKRFDNIFASKNVRITSGYIDQTSRASDHQPVMAEIRWD